MVRRRSVVAAVLLLSCAAPPSPRVTRRDPAPVVPTAPPPRAAAAASDCVPPPEMAPTQVTGAELSSDGRWALLRGDVSQVWELSPAAPVLRFRVELPRPFFRGADRLVVDDGRDVIVIDATRGALIRVEDATLVGPVDAAWVAVGPDRLRVLDPTTLAVRSEVALRGVSTPGSLEGVRLLLGGRRVLTDDMLAALDPPRVLASRTAMGAVSADERHVLACGVAGEELSVLSTDTGEAIGSFTSTSTVQVCGPAAALSPDARTLVIFEKDAEGATVLVAGDVATGALRVFPTRHRVGGALKVTLDVTREDPPRVCVSSLGKWETSRTCDWVLGADGSIVDRPGPPAERSRFGEGEEGGAASARSPSGAWRAVVQRAPGGKGASVRVDTPGRPPRGAAPRTLTLDGVIGDSMFPWAPTLTFVDETHVVFRSTRDDMRDALIDVVTGEVRRFDGPIAVAPGVVLVVGTSVTALASPSFAPVALAASAGGWARARRVALRCASPLPPAR
jgi:hypothetical protein